MSVKLYHNNLHLLDINVHENWVRTVKFIPNSRFVLTGGDDKKLIKYDLLKGEINQIITDAHEEFVTLTDVKSDSRYIISTGIGTLIK